MWRRYASIPILVLQIFVLATIGNGVIYGCVVALWLTVPCGIMAVNKHWWLWYPRQAIFATFSILAILEA